MNRGTRFTLTLGLFLITMHRLPAPISELPTPTPEQSVRPKSKQSSKAKSTTGNQPATSPKTFQATWRGTLKIMGDAYVFTLDVNTSGTVVNEQSPSFKPATLQAVCDGKTIKWNWRNPNDPNDVIWTLTPNPDGRTALVTVNNPPGFLKFGGWNSSATFLKTSP